MSMLSRCQKLKTVQKIYEIFGMDRCIAAVVLHTCFSLNPLLRDAYVLCGWSLADNKHQRHITLFQQIQDHQVQLLIASMVFLIHLTLVISFSLVQDMKCQLYLYGHLLPCDSLSFTYYRTGLTPVLAEKVLMLALHFAALEVYRLHFLHSSPQTEQYYLK